MKDQVVILFDGVCNFCNSAVNFVIKRDKGSKIKFSPIQSSHGQQIIKEHDFHLTYLSSFIFIEKGVLYTRSTAALKLCKYLDGAWPIAYGFIIVPKFIRDGIYNLIAKNRYKWFGQQDKCMVPTPDLKKRFL